jgi:DNA-binding NarL/FixJ family response regulator
MVDDNEAFLAAARVLLEREGMIVAGVASTSEEAFRQIAAVRPDVVLVDIFLGGESGSRLAQRLADKGDATVILISSHTEDDLSGLIAASPAAGFIPKAQLSAEAILRIVNRRAA